MKGYDRNAYFREKQTFGEKEAFFLLADVLAIVQHIHAHEIVHRDLRIPNLVFRDGVVYVIDFGLARFFHEQDGPFLTLEQKLRRQVDVKSDIYASVIFYCFYCIRLMSQQRTKRKVGKTNFPCQ
ncbi:Serine/threonine-protein kinase StkP [Anoxybacillus sp. BCO1]|nr:Serine/threonine-protein kinase StkP [Anoxybacillus sp. BCO1]